MKIDSHCHFWHFNEEEFGWIPDNMANIRRDMLPNDLEPELKKAGYDGVVAVQAPQTIAETMFLLSLAEKHSYIAGVVGWADLRADDIDDQLAELKQYQKLKGIRHIVQAEADPQFMLQSAFKTGIKALENQGLTYDILILHTQLQQAIDLVDSFPNQRFVVDHIAKPDIGAGLKEPWYSQMKSLSERDNVFVKLSGLVTEAGVTDWQSKDLSYYIQATIELFGAQRCMIGSDWPVSYHSASYPEIMGIVEKEIASLSESDKSYICGLTAKAFYQL
jgi:L-fuconolactonase